MTEDQFDKWYEDNYTHKYFLKADFNDEWTEVTKEKFCEAERQAGFRPKLSSDHPKYMTTCATGGFSGSGIQGKVESTKTQQPK